MKMYSRMMLDHSYIHIVHCSTPHFTYTDIFFFFVLLNYILYIVHTGDYHIFNIQYKKLSHLSWWYNVHKMIRIRWFLSFYFQFRNIELSQNEPCFYKEHIRVRQPSDVTQKMHFIVTMTSSFVALLTIYSFSMQPH